MSRRIKPDEMDLWKRVADTTERLHPLNPAKSADQKTRPGPKKPDPKPRPSPISPFRAGAAAKSKPASHDLMSSVSEQLLGAPLRMDRKTHTKMKRGKVKPEARIDLHGMTMDRAHPALTAFIMRSASDGKRLVLVITGKGKDRDDDGPIPVRRGVLRHNVPHWLSVPPLSQIVLQVVSAHGSHGGSGAYYVYLRKLR